MLGEAIRTLQSIFPTKLKQGESSDLSSLFRSRMFDNLIAQDEFYHHFGVPADQFIIYTTHKKEKRDGVASNRHMCD